MALNYISRIEHLKRILEDLYPEIEGEYTKSKGFSTAFVFNNLFEESWKLMKDILCGILGFSEDDDNVKGPRNVIKYAYENNVIDSEKWLKVLLDRNNSTHDYRSQNMEYYWNQIKNEYVHLVERLIRNAEMLIKKMD